MDPKQTGRNTEITVNIRIWGIVQGVGFRPFVAKIAKKWGMRGQVRNLGGLVEILVTDTRDRIDAFVEDIEISKPQQAEVVHIKKDEIPYQTFTTFGIAGSGTGDQHQVKANAPMVPADLAICKDCQRELNDPKNPRYHHPFISCMVCGPRYSIIDRVPYDRCNTTMDDFPMCEFCEREYIDIENRRHHAQTISCNNCGPYINDRNLNNMPLLQKAIADIQAGKIIGVKGMGGFNFACSPFDETAVKNLRTLKVREEKPFAVMFYDVDQIREHCLVSNDEERLLQSAARPIILLERRIDSSMYAGVHNTSRFLGAFLPSMGLQYLLIENCGPLIMTSANLSELPMIKDDDEMRQLVKATDLVGTVLYNQRRINRRMDDSVVRVIDGKPQMIRRSKGYAPRPIYMLGRGKQVLGTGGQLKSSFALSTGDFAYVSQYFGDLDHKIACDIYRENVDFMEKLFRITPECIVSDLHPLYATTKFAEEYAKEQGVPHFKVQHHHAHIASVMAEENIEEAVIGVSFDGTGYGTDGAIWGGEFLICENADFLRAGHLESIKMIGGDSSMKEGWKSCLCYLHRLGIPHHADGKEAELVHKALEKNINAIESSSMGRLFDAVAAFLKIQQVNRYEGECAIMLENAAYDGLHSGGSGYGLSFDIRPDLTISAKPIFEGMQAGMSEGVPIENIALGFHYAVSNMIETVCQKIREEKGITKVVLTGGVFQNKILMESTLKKLRENGFSVSYNTSVGPNDGGICLGQVWLGNRM